MNRWRIPPDLEDEIIQRDLSCVYCGISFSIPSARRGDRPTWEHIVNDARIVTRENIARCCMSCNASKGARDLLTWMSSPYCRNRGISADSVAAVVRNAIDRSTGCDGIDRLGEAGQHHGARVQVISHDARVKSKLIDSPSLLPMGSIDLAEKPKN